MLHQLHKDNKGKLHLRNAAIKTGIIHSGIERQKLPDGFLLVVALSIPCVGSLFLNRLMYPNLIVIFFIKHELFKEVRVILQITKSLGIVKPIFHIITLRLLSDPVYEGFNKISG